MVSRARNREISWFNRWVFLFIYDHPLSSIYKKQTKATHSREFCLFLPYKRSHTSFYWEISVNIEKFAQFLLTSNKNCYKIRKVERDALNRCGVPNLK
jgi:hypothetical protein